MKRNKKVDIKDTLIKDQTNNKSVGTVQITTQGVFISRNNDTNIKDRTIKLREKSKLTRRL